MIPGGAGLLIYVYRRTQQRGERQKYNVRCVHYLRSPRAHLITTIKTSQDRIT